MTYFVLIYILTYTFLLITFLLGGYSRLKRKNMEKGNYNKIKLEDLTVVIPFRNEENRLKGLLSSIQNSESHPISYIFVDDHSLDQSQSLIHKYLQGLKFEIVKLPKGTFGKKRALEKGISIVKTNYVLTLDADVVFETNYLNELSNLKECDLTILPVQYEHKNYFNGFLQQDVVLASLMNVAISGWKRPVLCSGANLLFSKESYLKCIKNSNYFDLDSGDDVFLMRAFQQENLLIDVHYKNKLSVSTSIPEEITDFFHQRLRWIGKSKKVGDKLSNVLAFSQFFLSVVNWLIIITLFTYLQLNQFITFLILKNAVEWTCTFSYYRDINKLNLWVLVPIYILLLPLTNLIIIVSSFFVKPRWKNRLIVQ